MKNRELLAMARSGFVKEVEMKEDRTLTVETTIPRFSAHWSKHTVSKDVECYQLLLRLCNLQEPGDVFDMQTLAVDKESPLYTENDNIKGE